AAQPRQHAAALVGVGVLDQHGGFPVAPVGNQRVVGVELALDAALLEDALDAQHLLHLVADGELVLEQQRDVGAEVERAILLVLEDAGAERAALARVGLQRQQALAPDHLMAAPISEKVRATSPAAGSATPSWRAICEMEKMPRTMVRRNGASSGRAGGSVSVSTTSACWRPARRRVATTWPTRAPSTSASAITSTSPAPVMMSATVSSSRRRPRCVAASIARSPRMSVAVITPSTFSRSSTASSRRTPRVIMNWLAPESGACGRMVAGATRARSVITSSAGEAAV